MKIYTKTGDDGNTNLFGGGGGGNSRVRKSDARIDSYGNVDELNGFIGWAAVVAPPADRRTVAHRTERPVHDRLAPGGRGRQPRCPPHSRTLDDSIVARLEMQIDAAVATLPPLRNFILPGRERAGGAAAHCADGLPPRRTPLVRFAEDRPVAPTILTFLNRLSDWLFVQARVANHANGVADIPWSSRT